MWKSEAGNEDGKLWWDPAKVDCPRILGLIWTEPTYLSLLVFSPSYLSPHLQFS